MGDIPFDIHSQVQGYRIYQTYILALLTVERGWVPAWDSGSILPCGSLKRVTILGFPAPAPLLIQCILTVHPLFWFWFFIRSNINGVD
jgi:hypothetical protein